MLPAVRGDLPAAVAPDGRPRVGALHKQEVASWAATSGFLVGIHGRLDVSEAHAAPPVARGACEKAWHPGDSALDQTGGNLRERSGYRSASLRRRCGPSCSSQRWLWRSTGGSFRRSLAKALATPQGASQHSTSGVEGYIALHHRAGDISAGFGMVNGEAPSTPEALVGDAARNGKRSCQVDLRTQGHAELLNLLTCAHHLEQHLELPASTRLVIQQQAPSELRMKHFATMQRSDVEHA